MIASRHIAPKNFWGLTKQVGPWKTTSVDLSHEALGYDSPHNQLQTVRPYQQNGSKAPTYEGVEIVSASNIRGTRGPGLRKGKIARAIAGKREEQRRAEIEERLAKEAKIEMMTQAEAFKKELGKQHAKEEQFKEDIVKPAPDPDTVMIPSRAEAIKGLFLDIPKEQRLQRLQQLDEMEIERLTSLQASQSGQSVAKPLSMDISPTAMVPIMDIDLVDRRSQLEQLINLERKKEIETEMQTETAGEIEKIVELGMLIDAPRAKKRAPPPSSAVMSIDQIIEEAELVNHKRRPDAKRPERAGKLARKARAKIATARILPGTGKKRIVEGERSETSSRKSL